VAPSFSTLPIEIEDIPKTEPVKQEIKKPEPIKPKVEPKPIKAVQPPPVPVAQTPQVQPTPVAETPNAFTAPAPVPPPPPVAARAVGPSDEYKAKVQAAVQAAFYYPMAAQEMGLTGRTRVGFVLTNTTASEAKIVTSSTIGIIDRAALQAVLKAVFPSPPAELRDKAIAYEIWIEFKPKAN
jgi:protein TonB